MSGVLVDVLRELSLARTALSDPMAVGDVLEAWRAAHASEWLEDPSGRFGFSVDRIDALMGALDPAELTRETMCFAVLALQSLLRALASRAEEEQVSFYGRFVEGQILSALDAMEQALARLDREDGED